MASSGFTSVNKSEEARVSSPTSPETGHSELTKLTKSEETPADTHTEPPSVTGTITKTAPITKDSEQAVSPTETDASGKKPKSTLVPITDRIVVKVGVKNEEALQYVCKKIDTGELKQLTFGKIPHKNIDWNSRAHVDKINAWSSQIFGRANLGVKTIYKWSLEEDLWVGFFSLSILKECIKREEGAKMPKMKGTVKAFNQFFEGKTFYKFVPSSRTGKGVELPPCEPRDYSSFAAKVNRLGKKTKERILVTQIMKESEPKRFRPKITEEVFAKFLHPDGMSPLEGKKYRKAQMVKIDRGKKKVTKEEWDVILKSLPDVEEDFEDYGEDEDDTEIKAEGTDDDDKDEGDSTQVDVDEDVLAEPSNTIQGDADAASAYRPSSMSKKMEPTHMKPIKKPLEKVTAKTTLTVDLKRKATSTPAESARVRPNPLGPAVVSKKEEVVADEEDYAETDGEE